ncbi:MAG: alanine--glyoxylate aminotransferase family protein [Chloroflexota bacterium]
MSDDHKRLFLPGPVEVRKEVLEAQSQWMVGHRTPEFADMFASLQEKLKQVFLTENRVYVSGSSGTGLWEGASRNAIRDDKKALHLVGGAFSDRWAKISEANGKQIDVIAVEWGQNHTADMIAEALDKSEYDAVCVVHNETSTGVTNPIKAMGEVVRDKAPDTLFMVDSVSGLLGAEIRADEWNIDLLLTSGQKAFALPPGIAFASVSDRLLERAKEIPNRGYYFDFLSWEKYIQKNNTASTPPISLMYAAERQLTDVLEEGLENRWQRHLQMRSLAHQWVNERGFGFFAAEGYRSPTVTCVQNTREIDVMAMANFMDERGFAIDKGYGKIKGKTFRIAHMGDVQVTALEEYLAGLDEFLGV